MHFGNGTHNLWAKEWGYYIILQWDKNNGKGVAILLNPNFSYTVKGYTEIIIGRLQAVEITFNDKDLVILNIYGPNTDDVTHFDTLETYIKDNTDTTIIIGKILIQFSTLKRIKRTDVRTHINYVEHI